MKRIIDIQLAGLVKRLEERKIHVELTDAAKEELVREGYDPAYGARPLKRTIQRRVLDPLALRVLEGDFGEGDTVVVDRGSGRARVRKAGGGQSIMRTGRRRHRACVLPACQIMASPKPKPRLNPRGGDRRGPRPTVQRPGSSLWYGLAFLLVLGFAQLYFLTPPGRSIPYSEFKTLLKDDQIADVTISEQVIRGTLKQPRPAIRSSRSSSRRPASRIRS